MRSRKATSGFDAASDAASAPALTSASCSLGFDATALHRCSSASNRVTGGRAASLGSERDQLVDILHDGLHLRIHAHGTRHRIILAFASLLGGHHWVGGSQRRAPARAVTAGGPASGLAPRMVVYLAEPRREGADEIDANVRLSRPTCARCSRSLRKPPSTEDSTVFIMSRQASIDDATMRIEVRACVEPFDTAIPSRRGDRYARPVPRDPHARSCKGFCGPWGKSTRNAASAPPGDRSTRVPGRPPFLTPTLPSALRCFAPQNPSRVVGSGFIQFPPQRPFAGPLLTQPPTVSVRDRDRRKEARRTRARSRSRARSPFATKRCDSHGAHRPCFEASRLAIATDARARSSRLDAAV